MIIQDNNNYHYRKEVCGMLNKKNFDYFIEHLDEFLKEHYGKFVVVKDEEVLGFYDSFDEAIEEALKEYEIGTFIVQECVNNERSANTFYSNNVCFCEV